MNNLDINQEFNNYDKTKPIIVAVSTGVDSMVLLDIVIKNGFNVIIAHVNHNKRDASIIEQQYLESFCSNNKLQLHILQYHFNENNNFQEDARNKRYDFFYQLAIKYNAKYIFTAHHAQDNVETIIMNIFRGSNLKGYGGISKYSNFKNIIISRPLLNYSKDWIYQYANANNIDYFEDVSNLSNDYTRNKIRNNLLPMLNEINDNYLTKFTQFSNLLTQSFDFIRKTSLQYIKDNSIELNVYLKLDECIQKDIINYLFEQYQIINYENKINDCHKMLLNDKTNSRLNVGNNLILVKEYNHIYITDEKKLEIINEKLDFDGVCEISKYGTFYFENKLSVDYSPFLKICYNIKEFPLTIRTRKDGDKINITTGHKKIKDLFIDNKVPINKRDEILIVENSQNEIIWVMGYYRKPIDESKEFKYLVYEEKNNA